MIRTDNGYGAATTIAYRSVKAGAGLHQVPFPEIVVESISTAGTAGLGGDLVATRYAYGGAELVFDPGADSFTFLGYRRRIVLLTPVAQPDGVATFTITDTYAPVSAVDPYGLTTTPSLTRAQRYAHYLRRGRVRDVTVLSGQIGPSAISNPSFLLDTDVNIDARRIAATHHEWDARLLSSSTDPAGPEACTEMVYPYDAAASAAFAASHESYDACIVRGFGFASSAQSWRGNPGAAPPSTDNIETRSEIQAIDHLGRPLRVAQLNDVHRTDDDLCVDTTYAAPTGTNERVLSAVSSRTISGCTSTILSLERWDYDQLARGSVSAGFITSHTMERRSDAGTLLATLRMFDATYDAAGNLTVVTSTREDGATRTLDVAYDPFGLTAIRTTTRGTGVPSLQTTITPDPLTLQILSVTEPNGTQHGTTLDGFDRQILSTITPPGGTAGALSVMSYLGFSGSDPEGRRIVSKIFTDPVDPTTAGAAPGRIGTAYLDELGRLRRTELPLGADYQNQSLIIGRRIYDALGRVVFEADPHPSTQSLATAYGTTQFFDTDGTLSCVVRGHGPQATVPSATDESAELYPTCIQRVFQNHTEVVSTRDAASFLSGSPQAGVMHSSYTTAVGRLLARSTWQGAARLEHATFSHDRLGHRTGMTRYRDASTGANPVTSSWRYDSLGQLLELHEPDSVPQHYLYSHWGELREVTREIVPGPQEEGGPPPPDTDPPPNQLRVVNTYDALGRVIRREQRNGNEVIAETINDFFYDQPVSGIPHVTPTHTLGRLALATSPTGSEAFSYDAFGRIDARAFTDNHGELYIEKHAFHGDGAPQSLDLLLPDTAFEPEHVAYEYDSARRGKRVTYTQGGNTRTLFAATTIDPFGRIRQATYGATSYTAGYADIGRRLLNQVTLSSPSGSRSMTYQGYDPVGRERSRLEARSGGANSTTTWSYDALGRLSSAVQTRNTTTAFNQQFTYDPLGNVLSLSSTGADTGTINTTLTYSTLDRDRICRIRHGADSGTACNVTYDEVGAIVVQPTATGQRQLSYFVDGSVRTITDTLGSAAQFRYDAFGRVQELDLTSSVSQDVRRDRRYGELFAWRDVPAAGTTTSYLARKIPGPDGFLATRRGAGGPWVFEFGEMRGNRFFTDDSGAFVQDVDYQAYGKPASTGAQPGSLLYSNEQWNQGDLLAAFGISQLGARLYDPAIGRFMSRDPLLIPRTSATTNPYAFAMNDPVNLSDPTGLDPGSICNGIDAGQCVIIEREAFESMGPQGLQYAVYGGIGFPAPPLFVRGPRYSGPNGPSSDSDGEAVPTNTVDPAALRHDLNFQSLLARTNDIIGACVTPEERRRYLRQRMRPDDLASHRTTVLDGTEESFEEAKARAVGGLIGLGLVLAPSLVMRFLPAGPWLLPSAAMASPDPGLDDFVQRLRNAGVIILNVNVGVLGNRGQSLTEIDIVTPNAMIEYKGPDTAPWASGLIRQYRKQEQCTLRPVVVFIDGAGAGVAQVLRRTGRHILVTNDFQLLVDVIK